MQRTTITGLGLALLIMFSGQLSAQALSPLDKLKEITRQIKTMKTYGYDYEINAIFPNGQTDRLTGETFTDGANMMLFNKSNAHTILLSPNWLYRADHRNKSITVVNLSRHFNHKDQQEWYDGMFNSNISSGFLDSIVVKHGVLKAYRERNDTVSIEVVFSVPIPLKKIELTFDYKNKIPVAVKIHSFYPQDESTTDQPGKIGTSHTVSCTNYRKDIRMFPADFIKYFAVKGEKIELSQYRNYKLHTLL